MKNKIALGNTPIVVQIVYSHDLDTFRVLNYRTNIARLDSIDDFIKETCSSDNFPQLKDAYWYVSLVQIGFSQDRDLDPNKIYDVSLPAGDSSLKDFVSRRDRFLMSKLGNENE